MTSKIKLTIKGKQKLQGVGFRLHLFKKALELEIANFQADNQPNEKEVIVLLGGDEERIGEYVEFVKAMESGNPGNFRLGKVVSDDHEGRVMTITNFGSYLTNDQLMMGRDVLVTGFGTLGSDMKSGFEGLGSDMKSGFEGVGNKITEMGDRFAETVSDGFRHTNKRIDKLTKKDPSK